MNNILKELRKAMGLTQVEVARMMNMSRTTYTNIETGARNPSIETMTLISSFYNVPIDVAFGNNKEAYEDADAQKLLCIYKALNATGRDLLVGYAEMLAGKPAYREEESAKSAM